MEQITNAIYAKSKNEIERFNGVYIPLDQLHSWVEGITDDMPVFLQSFNGQNAFREVIQKLVSDGTLLAVGKKKNHHGLPLKFRKVKQEKNKDSDVVKLIIQSIRPPASIDYYLKNIDDYIRDGEIIEKVCTLLMSSQAGIVSVNERAYDLFGDEKFFKGDEASRSRGEVVLKRLGLSYTDIGCEEMFEPFFSFQKKDFHSRSARNVYIIENRDTFWSFKRYMMDLEKVDMLIYGEGKKIISSFRFVDEYCLSERDTFYYYGDLDAEGVNILGKLQDDYPRYNIVPFCEAYLALLDIGLRRGLARIFNDQKLNECYGRRFVGAFEDVDAMKFAGVLDGGFYVPQEALKGIEMKERFVGLW